MHFASIGDRIEFGEISNDIGLPNVGMTISTWFQGEAYPDLRSNLRAKSAPPTTGPAAPRFALKS